MFSASFWSFFLLLEWQMVSSSVFNKPFKRWNTFPATSETCLFGSWRPAAGGFFLRSLIPDCRLHIIPACLDRPVDCSYLLLGAFSWLVVNLPVNRTSLRTASFYLNHCSLRLSIIDFSLCEKISGQFSPFRSNFYDSISGAKTVNIC